MNYLGFREALLPFKVFSIGDTKKCFPFFDTRRLVEWQQKGYILKIINGWYLFTEVKTDETLIQRISNCICQPSYISLESALSYYNIIPEAVFTIQAITTKKTQMYATSAGAFNYRSIKPSLFFGYQILGEGILPILIAEKEKAILDYFYLNSHIENEEDIEALRFNADELQTIDHNKFENYLAMFANKSLAKRIANFNLYLPYAAS